MLCEMTDRSVLPFSGFGSKLGRSLLLFIMTIILGLVAQAGVFAGRAIDSPALIALGWLVYVVAMVMFVLPMYFSYFFLVDRDLPAIDALTQAYNAFKDQKTAVVTLSVASGLVAMSGVLALGIGLLVSMPVSYLMWASAYRQVVGSPGALGDAEGPERPAVAADFVDGPGPE